MKNWYVASVSRTSVLATVIMVLGGCSFQKANLIQPELAAAQQCIANQEIQSQRVEQQQSDILTSLSQVQQQLSEQQKAIEARPQVIEKTVRINCPAKVTPKAIAENFKRPPATDKLIVGLREQVLINGLNVVMPARISTNVTNSVLDARNMQVFERNGEEWIRFTVYNPTSKEPHVLERKRLRFQTVQSSSETTDRRPVVEMRFTIGTLTQKGEFILADRTGSEFPVLIGRNLLRDVMLVDVSANNLAPLQPMDEPSSSEPTKK